jgi:parallel beta-helix repeat protein
MANKNIKIQQNNGEGYDTLFPHTLGGIVELTGYTKPASTSAVSEEDSVNTAIGKLEKGLDDVAYSSWNVPSGGTTGQVLAKNSDTDYDTEWADGGGGGAGTKVARFVVGTSASGWTAADCDYLCDGTADQVEINSAITALPATGGEVVILDGTYNITARIDVTKDNVSIVGNGNATILKRMFNSSVIEGVIMLISRSGCKIANLQIDGNKAIYTNGKNHGIHLKGSNSNAVTGNTCNNNSYGIYLSYSSYNNTVTGNTCNNNDNYGISLTSSSNNTVTGNICYNNNNSGIYLSSSSDNNAVTGNTCNNNDFGIYLESSNNNTVTGNTCNSNSYGINLYLSSRNTVTGNTCIRGTGLTTDYTTSQHTIQLNGTGNNNNLIAMNNCMGKAVTNGGGTGNTLVNNKFDATYTGVGEEDKFILVRNGRWI